MSGRFDGSSRVSSSVGLAEKRDIGLQESLTQPDKQTQKGLEEYGTSFSIVLRGFVEHAGAD